MPELRWILIGFAVVLLAGIYLWGRRNDARESRSEGFARSRPEPTLFADELGAQAHESAPHFDDAIESTPAYLPEREGEVFDDDVTVERKLGTARPFSANRQDGVETSRTHEPRIADSHLAEVREVESRAADARRRVEPIFGN